MKLRSMFYDALRAAPLYPRRWAVLALFVVAVMVAQVVFGWPVFAGLFVLAWLVAMFKVVDGGGVGRAVLVTLAAFALLAGCVYVTVHWSAALVILAGLAVFAAVTAGWLFREVLPTFTTRAAIVRRGVRSQYAGGVASKWDLAEHASVATMRLRAGVLRPSLAGVERVDPWQVASLLVVQDGWRGLRRWTRPIREVWSACEDTTLRIGGPRTGKTISLAEVARRAPGALLTTSTRADLAEWVHGDRRVYPATAGALAGKPRDVHVFNPTGYGDIRSTVRWSILVGCENYTTAVRRAEDLIPEAPSVHGEEWDRKARAALPIFLNAAARAERTVEDVARWIRDAADAAGKERTRREITNILSVDPGSDQRIGLLNQFLSFPDNTRGSVTAMMTPAVAWVSDDVARAIGAAPLGAITLDIPRFILRQETLHIIGPSAGNGMMTPLTSALVAEIAHQGRMLAATMPGERLDPPLTMALDEIAVTVRLPLPDWTADFGGRGIKMDMSVQSLSQLIERWGAAGAGTLRGNVGSLLLYGGGKDTDELEKISALCGTYRMRVVGEDHERDGRRDGERRGEFRWVPVLTAADLMNMPPGHVALLHRNLSGVVTGRTPTTLDAGVQRLPLSSTDLTVVGEVVDFEPAARPAIAGEAIA